MAIRSITIETSWFDSPKQWNPGLEIWETKVFISYPDSLSAVEDEILLELALNEHPRVKFEELDN